MSEVIKRGISAKKKKKKTFSTQSYFHCIQLKMHLLQSVKVSKFGCLMFCAESFEFDWWENMFGKVARGNIFQGRRRHFAANQLNSRSKNKNEEELKIWRGGIWMRGIFNHLSGENFACFILMVQPITSNVPRFQARCSPYSYLCAHPHVNQLLSPPSPHSFSPPLHSKQSSPHFRHIRAIFYGVKTDTIFYSGLFCT